MDSALLILIQIVLIFHTLVYSHILKIILNCLKLTLYILVKLGNWQT